MVEKIEKILSFDVGIIHLAYCLLSKKLVDGKYQWDISDWAIIDLADRQSHKCDVCKKNATWMQNIKEEKYYCKVHSKNLLVTPFAYDDYFKTLDKKQLNGCNYVLSNDSKCDKNCLIKDLSGNTFCGTHGKSIYKKMTTDMKLKKIKKTCVANLDFDDTRLKLVMELEARKHLLEANVVVIENQPSFKNPRMKSISGIIYDYFMIRGMVDKAITKSNIEKVKFMSPSNKIKLASDGETQQIVKLKADSEDSKAYKLTKSLAVKYTQEMVKHLPFWLNDFNSHKKKDDLADAFLQGAYYFEMNIKLDDEKVYKKTVAAKSEKKEKPIKDDTLIKQILEPVKKVKKSKPTMSKPSISINIEENIINEDIKLKVDTDDIEI